MSENKCTTAGSPCEDHFITRQSARGLIWGVVSLGGVLIAGIIGWAILTSSAIASMQTTQTYQEDEIKGIKSEQAQIMGLLGRIDRNSADAAEMMRGKWRPRP